MWSSRGDLPEHVVERRDPADDLLDEAGHERRVGGRGLPLVGVLGEDGQAAGDDGARGLGAAGDEEPRLVHHRHRVVARLGPHRDEVVHRAALALGGDLLEQRVELHDRRHHPHGRLGVAEHRVGAHEPLRPRLDVLPAVLGEPEQVGGEPRRQLGGQAVHHLDLAGVGHRVEQLVDPALRGTASSCRTARGVNRRLTSCRCARCSGSSWAIMFDSSVVMLAR